MTKRFLLLCIGTALIYACDSPKKNGQANASGGDSTKQSLVLSHAADTAATEMTPPDTSALAAEDSIIVRDTAITTFDRNDPSSYLKLANYMHPLHLLPEPEEIQTVDSTCALLIYPSDEQLEALKKESGDDFRMIATDNTYYHGVAIEMLDAINVETIVAEARYIDFSDPKTKKLWRIDIRKEGAPAWNLIFFKEGHEPEIIPYADLSKEKIHEYFEIK